MTCLKTSNCNVWIELTTNLKIKGLIHEKFKLKTDLKWNMYKKGTFGIKKYGLLWEVVALYRFISIENLHMELW